MGTFLAILVVAVGVLIVYIGVTGSQSKVWDLLAHTGNATSKVLGTGKPTSQARL